MHPYKEIFGDFFLIAKLIHRTTRKEAALMPLDPEVYLGGIELHVRELELHVVTNNVDGNGTQ